MSHFVFSNLKFVFSLFCFAPFLYFLCCFCHAMLLHYTKTYVQSSVPVCILLHKIYEDVAYSLKYEKIYLVHLMQHL